MTGVGTAERCAPAVPRSSVRCPVIALGGLEMLGYAWVFLVLAAIAAVFGFGGVAATAAGIAKIFFFIFLALFVVGLLAGRKPV
jgi:uncharacterized membrane protein YtjA (UPF0391 family)